MKKIITTALIILGFFLTCNPLFSQPPPPPGGHGSSGNQPAGDGAPIGGGLFILLGLGAAYGGKKIYDLREENLEE